MILMIYDPIPLILYTLPKCLISLRAHGFWGVFNIRGKGFFIAVIGMFQKKTLTWSVVSTPLKNISQLVFLFPYIYIYGKS